MKSWNLYQSAPPTPTNHFCHDHQPKMAIITEIIGEASYMLSLDFQEAHPDTNWKVIVAMRHFLVHGYYQVDPEEVWNVIEQDLLPLKEQVEKYLAEME